MRVRARRRRPSVSAQLDRSDRRAEALALLRQGRGRGRPDAVRGRRRRRPAGPEHARQPRPPGRPPESAAAPTSLFSPGKADDDGPPIHSMLGDLASHSGPVPESEPVQGSLFSAGEAEDDGRRSTACSADLASQSGPMPEAEAGPHVDALPRTAPEACPSSTTGRRSPGAHLTQHSTIAELAGLEEHDVGTFPIERGILISIIFHLLLVIAMLTMPRIKPGSKEDFFAAMVARSRRTTRRSRSSSRKRPGPARPNPKQIAALGRGPARGRRRQVDAEGRHAVRAARPTASRASRPGPGRRAFPEATCRPRQAAKAEAERRAAEQKSEENQKAAEYPTTARPQTSGPREVGKLAGLDRAIAEAGARDRWAARAAPRRPIPTAASWTAGRCRSTRPGTTGAPTRRR